MPSRRSSAGFTLVELMVALFAMALLAVMSWRGLDGMARAQTQLRQHSDDVLALQVGLQQWAADLEAVTELPQTTALDWNGRVLRIVRRSGVNPGAGLVVAAWTRRIVDGRGMWLRWQSGPVTTRGDLNQAWQRADLWSQNPGEAERRGEVAITPLADWQVFYFRGNAWTNPQSSDATTATLPASTPPPNIGGGMIVPANASRLPDGVRLVLELPPGGAISGTLTRDWVRPTLSGGKS
jgi:general secretion pathway protein J